MYHNPNMHQTMPVGIVLRRAPGVTRWAATVWSVSDVLPGAGPANWHELRREGDVVEYHAATLTLELHGAETEAYVHGLAAKTPSLFVVMRPSDTPDVPLDVLLITASPYEAQDYTDSGEEIVEPVPMSPAMLTWVQDFTDAYHTEEVFVKRRRDKKRVDERKDGIGDARIPQMADVYRAPASAKKERLQ